MNDIIHKDGIEFKKIPDYPGYCINESGTKVVSIKRNRNGTYLKIVTRNKSNPYVTFSNGKERKNIALEYLVAKTYLENPHNHILVRRKNESDGNHLDNLEWWSGSEEYPFMVWKEIPDKENYMISEYGHILSLKRVSPQILKTFDKSDGTKFVKLSENDEEDHNFVHYLVAETFLQDQKKGNKYVIHIGDKKYNHYSNLKWVKNLNGDIDELEWRQLEKFPKYSISENGDIKSHVHKIPKIIERSSRDWIQIYDEKEIGHLKLREELTAMAFLENKNGYKYVVHIDGDNKNRHYTNLQWCEYPEIPKDDGLDWRPIKGFKEYFINIRGEIKSFQKGKPYILNPHICTAGYFVVSLYSSGSQHVLKVHKLMALTYLPNPENKPVVDHIDRNKLNNNLSNLRWVTYKENSANRNEYSGVAKEIAQIDYEGNIVRIFSSAAEATKVMNIKIKDKIPRCARGEIETVEGYKWKYINDDDNEELYEPEADEIFKPVVGYYKTEKIYYPNYKISNYGTLINIESGLKRKPVENVYKIYNLTYEGVSKSFYTHVLVASFFIDGMTEDRCYVNHKDENKHNFHWTNLEWITHEENVRYSVNRKKYSRVILEIEELSKIDIIKSVLKSNVT